MPRGIPLALGVPDIGGLLTHAKINNHATFRDNCMYVLNNHHGFNQIHIHRDASRRVVFVCKKTTADGAAPGVSVLNGSALWQAAVAKVAGLALA